MRRSLIVLTSILLATVTLSLAAADPSPSTSDQPAPIGADLAETIEQRDDEVRVLVTVAGDAPALRETAESSGLDVKYAYEHIPVIAGSIHADLVQELARQPWVTEITQDQMMHANMDVSRVEALAPQANAAGLTGEGINVAVVDTGIDRNHAALEGRTTGCVKIEGGVHYPVCDDDNGHGTHVAGTIGARPTTTQPSIEGIAPDVTFSAVKVLNTAGAGLNSDVIEGMEWVINHKDEYGIRVMSMSLGGEECGDGTSPSAQMADQVVEAGIVAVIAAGNSGPADCSVSTPGTAEKVVTVGAVDDFGTKNWGDDHVADFSSRGPTKDGRIKPDVLAPGVAITSTYLAGSYATLDGTSMATPHVSGVVATMIQQDPTLTPSDVKSKIHQTGIELPGATSATPNNDIGWGFVNTCDLLGLSDCSQPASLTDVHAGDLSLSFEHYGNGGHRVLTTVPVADAGGSPVSGANVQVTTTSPSGSAYENSGKTGSSGDVTLKAQQKDGGHGTWDSCVDAIWGAGLRYTPSSNVEDCDSLTVSH